MSEILNRLANGEQITEWLDPWDQRLIDATGQKAPNPGGTLREKWRLPKHSGLIAAQLVKKCLIVQPCRGQVDAHFEANELTYLPQDKGTIVLSFSDRRDWSDWFPASRKTEIFKNEDDQQAWAALAVCGKDFGLAVFAQETEDTGVEARIQTVPDQIFQRILAP